MSYGHTLVKKIGAVGIATDEAVVAGVSLLLPLDVVVLSLVLRKVTSET